MTAAHKFTGHKRGGQPFSDISAQVYMTHKQGSDKVRIYVTSFINDPRPFRANSNYFFLRVSWSVIGIQAKQVHAEDKCADGMNSCLICPVSESQIARRPSWVVRAQSWQLGEKENFSEAAGFQIEVDVIF